ncbi:MAG: hypothetical protein LBT11_01815 [Treponema sp.]|jgi:hypothetical protein|nr:hypothetical protein [Treponema sp.]
MKKNIFSLLSIIAIGAVMTLASCATFQPIDVTNTMAAQITSIKFYTPASGEEVKTLFVDRTGSFLKDISLVEDGAWYRLHQDKLVSVEAVVKNTSYLFFSVVGEYQWRIEYVD